MQRKLDSGGDARLSRKSSQGLSQRLPRVSPPMGPPPPSPPTAHRRPAARCSRAPFRARRHRAPAERGRISAHTCTLMAGGAQGAQAGLGNRPRLRACRPPCACASRVRHSCRCALRVAMRGPRALRACGGRGGGAERRAEKEGASVPRQRVRFSPFLLLFSLPLPSLSLFVPLPLS